MDFKFLHVHNRPLCIADRQEGSTTMQQQYNMGHLASKRNGGSDLSLNTTRRGQTLFEVLFKVEKILEDSLDLILSPSPAVKIQVIGGKVYWR